MTQYFSFQWHITDNCDQRCRHCYIFAENRTKPLVNMNLDQMREVLRRCEEFCQARDAEPNFAITGGDPILNPDFWPLMELIRDKGYMVSMMGNPFHLTDEVCRRLKDCGVKSYQVSLDGMEKTHDWFRKPGSFQKTLEVLPMISRSGMQATVMMTVSQINYKELPDVMDTVAAHGADRFAFARYVPTSSEKENSISPLEYRALLDTYIKKRKKFMEEGCFTQFGLKEHLFTLYAYEEGMIKLPEYNHVPGECMPAGCHCANRGLSILPDGSVMACRRTEGSVLGNIFTDDLAQMWEKDISFYRQYDKIENCNRCKLSPWCRGCPAVAYGMTGSFFGGDPQCWHVVEQD